MKIKNKLVKKILAVFTGICVCALTIYLLVLSQVNKDKEPSVLDTILPIILSTVVVIGVFSFMGEDSPVRKYIRYKKWVSFGNRLKVAYEAKFGYRNPAFDEEIDHRVKAMRSLGKGYTKSVNYSKLKALAKFVEVPFIIPEEEMLAEEDKTRSFSKI
jgi:hypothetical protein